MNETQTKPVVTLVGQDGNVFHILGVVRRALIEAGQPDLAAEFVGKAMSAHSYDSVIALVYDYCEVI